MISLNFVQVHTKLIGCSVSAYLTSDVDCSIVLSCRYAGTILDFMCVIDGKRLSWP